MKNFDGFIGIDWSGALSPVYTRSISVAICTRGNKPPQQVLPSAGRYWSRALVGDYLKNLARGKNRYLVGIDANFGYAQEIGALQFGDQYTAHDLWAGVENICSGDENYYAGRFWGRYPEFFWCAGTKPEHIRLPKRQTEIECGQGGFGWPESPFKLIGPKQVGKGGLAAMRLAFDLKQSCGDEVCIWPFENDLTDQARLVVTEIYPRQFLMRAGHGKTKIKSGEDLCSAMSYFGFQTRGNFQDTISDHDADALISAAGLRWLCGDEASIPSSIANPAAMKEGHRQREGWIFGI